MIDLVKLEKFIQESLTTIYRDSFSAAKAVHFIYWFKLYPGSYKSYDDYFSKKFDINKKTLNFYINVIQRFFDFDKTLVFSNDICYSRFYCVKEGFKNYNFSQLKSLLGLSDDDIDNLEISPDSSCREIEAKKKNFTIERNKQLGAAEKNIVKHCKLDPDQIKTIPDNSEYEFIFKRAGSLKKGSSRTYNSYTVSQMLRKYIETNDESEFYFALVKIPRSLDD